MRIVSQKEMKELEVKTIKEFGFREELIIENVGLRGADYIRTNCLKDFSGEIVVLLGSGSNGADGLAIARHLVRVGFKVTGFTLFPKKDCSDEFNNQLKLAQSFGVKIFNYSGMEELSSFFNEARKLLVIDAIFGTGLRLPLPNFLYDVIKLVNDLADTTIALDIPTGVVCDTGAIQGNAIDADVTLAIALPKLGHYISHGARLSGKVEVLDVGFPKELLKAGDKFLLQIEDVIDTASKRSKFSHKNNFGHTLVVGGSHGLTGALALTTGACLRVGTGLVTGVTWEKQYHEYLVRVSPEIMTGLIPQDESKWSELVKELEKYDSVVIGPGLGRTPKSRKIVLEILNNFAGPVVLDADAINVLNLKEDRGIFSMRNAPTVLTPHFGEFARFTGAKMADLLARPVDHLRSLVETINCSVILKGPCTYLGFSSGGVYFNYFPNDGMAKAGAGDVLSGIIGGLLGQELNKESGSLLKEYKTFDRVVALGVLIHSRAGFHAAKSHGPRSMSAGTIINCLQDAFLELEQNR